VWALRRNRLAQRGYRSAHHFPNRGYAEHYFGLTEDLRTLSIDPWTRWWQARYAIGTFSIASTRRESLFCSRVTWQRLLQATVEQQFQIVSEALSQLSKLDAKPAK